MRNSWSYGKSIKDFLEEPKDAVLGTIFKDPQQFCVLEQQREAWMQEIDLLQGILGNFKDNESNRIYFEYNLMRFAKKVDVVLILEGILTCLEFKCDFACSAGSKPFLIQDKNQVMAYADEFAQFHSTSRYCPIVPILVVTSGVDYKDEIELHCENIFNVLRANKTTLADYLVRIIDEVPKQIGETTPLKFIENVTEWELGEYQTVPTVVEAAARLFENQSVEAITRSGTDVTETMKAIAQIIEQAEKNHERVICFVTGEPGAGKTLVGLKLAAETQESTKKVNGESQLIRKVFLSGNYPLVKVLKESLVRNLSDRLNECLDRLNKDKKELTTAQNAFIRSCGFKVIEEKLKSKKGGVKKYLQTLSEFSDKGKRREEMRNASTIEFKPRKYSRTFIKATVGSMIQMVSNFRLGWETSDKPPTEHVFIFDEAQRAWSAQQVKSKDSKTHHDQVTRQWSEPRTLLEYLNRHADGDWCVAVALVGEGQDIHAGEAGIGEWYAALDAESLKAWKICASTRIEDSKLFKERFADSDRVNVYEDIEYGNLHLSKTQRSYRSQEVGRFVNALLKGQNGLVEAKEALAQMKDFPLFLTRDVDAGKKWMQDKSINGERRCGMVLSSRGVRLRRDGFIAQAMGFDEATWFLDGVENVNSSNACELSATEFKIQGLELDYVLVGWDGDLLYDPESGEFECRHFKVKQNAWVPVKKIVVTDIDDDDEEDAGENDVDPRDKDRHLRNSYRVLLTRARQGMVIFIPKGDDASLDESNRSKYNYDPTYKFLHDEIGIKDLDDSV